MTENFKVFSDVGGLERVNPLFAAARGEACMNFGFVEQEGG